MCFLVLFLEMYLLKLIPCRKSNWSHVGSIPAISTKNNNIIKTSIEKQNLVIKLRLQGNTYKQIQDQVGVYKNTIIKILRDNNMLKNPPKELTKELLYQIQNRYNECNNIKVVAKEFGISYSKLKGKIILKDNKNF